VELGTDRSSSESFRLERRHVDHEAIFDVLSEHALPRFVDLLNRNDLDVRRDPMLRAELQHLLGLRNAADGRAGKIAAWQQQVEGRHGQRVFRRADKGERAIELQKFQLGIDIVLGGYGVEDEVEAAKMSFHLLLVPGDDDLMRAETQLVGGLPRRSRKENDMRAEGPGKFHAHMAEAAKTDDTDLLTGTDLPVAQWRISRDARAQQRRSCGKIQACRNVQDEVFLNHDTTRVAAKRWAPKKLVLAIVSEDGQERQYCSCPAWQFGQVRQESTIDPTAARSPGLNFATRSPTRVTRPTIS
jgi:hypothetical protein